MSFAERLYSLLLPLALLHGCTEPLPERSKLTIFAASSLTEAFGALERSFEAQHPEVDVSLVLAGSQTLRLQIEQGAPADVFASADPAHIQALIEQGLIERSSVFAHNTLAIIVPKDNPAGLRSFEDLPRAQRLVVGAPQVPVGAYTQALLGSARSSLGAEFADQVLQRVVSMEPNARLVRAKVELGEADAAIVYRTDALASSAVQTLMIPRALNVQAEYHAGALSGHLAQRFIDHLLSEEGRAQLVRLGFQQ